jgi:hypothetical protein
VLVADLEELDADLPGERAHVVELARRLDNDALDIVARHAVRHHNDVERCQASKAFESYLIFVFNASINAAVSEWIILAAKVVYASRGLSG